jgi:hypothetical protein
MRAGVRWLQTANAGGTALGEQLAFPVRALAAAALAALVVGAMLDAGLVGGRETVTAPSAGIRALSRASRLGLPAAAAGPVSQALGADDPAYLVHGSGDVLTASSRSQHLHTTFTTGGVSVGVGGAHVGLRVRALGDGSALAPVAATAPRAAGNRVVYARAGLSEWYANGPFGLEQGFTIAHAPTGRTAGPLTLSIALSGNVRASLARGGRSVTLSHDGERVLGYGGLSATDARGRSLRSWMALSGGRLLLRVDAAHAHYPVRIDPLIETTELTAEDGATGDYLGGSVAVSGNMIVAGAPTRKVGSNPNQGELYVFEEQGSGWKQTAELTAKDGALDTEIGTSVAVSGNTIVAGASGREEERGAAYVFERSGAGSSWAQVAELTASDAVRYDRLGWSVAIAGDAVVAGAPVHKVGSEAGAGAVYVFEKPGSGWTNGAQTAELTASDATSMDDELGYVVAASGNTIFAGAANYRNGRGHTAGAVYVYEKPGPGWENGTQTAKLTASDGELGDTLGASLAASGETVVAGAPWHKDGSGSARGAAYVFERPASGWANGTQTAELTPSDGDSVHSFGFSVALSGETIVVGSPAELGLGSLYLFGKPSSRWENAAEPRTYPPSSGVTGADIGWSAALSGTTLASGEPLREDKTGAVLVFMAETSKPATTTSTPSTTTTGPSKPARPAITGLAESARSWREGKRLASFSRRHRLPPVGTTFSFDLNVPATVTVTFTRSASGRRVGKRCAAPTSKNRGRRRCTRAVHEGGFVFPAQTGSNSVRFDGVISKHKKLVPSTYTLTVTATAPGGLAAPRTLDFTITG